MDARFGQPWKAPFPIIVTEPGMTMLVSPVHSSKARAPIFFYGVWNSDVGQSRAAIECQISNLRHGIGNDDACQSRAVFESSISDSCHVAWNTDADQSLAAFECVISNLRHGIGNDGFFASGNHLAGFRLDERIAILP